MKTLMPTVCRVVFLLICAALVSCAAPLAGTKWAGKESDGATLTCEFQSTGKLRYITPTGDFSNGTWRQDRSGIYMETNRKYSEYVGQITGNSMSGKAWNIKGLKWTWQLSKVPAPQ